MVFYRIKERKGFDFYSCKTMKLCIFGGSFDPIHEGHMRVAVHARERCCLDKVLFMPCSLSPLKEQKPFVTNEQRCRMIELALQGFEWAVLDRSDLELPPPSWSWRIAELIADRNPEAELFWLMGKDQWDSLEQWGRWEYLSELVTFIVYHRGGVPLPKDGVRAVFIAGDEPASSTQVRCDLRMGVRPVPHLNKLVESFIRREGLYNVPQNESPLKKV